MPARRGGRSAHVYSSHFCLLTLPTSSPCHCLSRAPAPHIALPAHRPRCDLFSRRQMFRDRALGPLHTSTTLPLLSRSSYPPSRHRRRPLPHCGGRPFHHRVNVVGCRRWGALSERRYGVCHCYSLHTLTDLLSGRYASTSSLRVFVVSSAPSSSAIPSSLKHFPQDHQVYPPPPLELPLAYPSPPSRPLVGHPLE